MWAFLIVFLYFIPAINGYSRKKKNAGSILVLNLFLGWSIIGWIIALIWSMNKDEETTVVVKAPETHKSVSNELAELFKLKEQGAITEEEFKAHKAKLLS